MIALSALFLATLCTQEPQLRIPLAPSARQVVPPSATHSTAEIRIYDLAKLTGHQALHKLTAEFEAYANSRSIEETLDQFRGLDRARKRAEQTTDHLISSIRDLITPALVPEFHDLRHLERGKIALLANLEQHAWIEGLLRAAEEFRGVINLKATIYKFDREQRVGRSKLRSGSVLSDVALGELLTDLGLLGVEAISSPQILTNPFQQAQLTILKSIAYVKDFELRVLPGLETEIADPVIDIVQSGILLNFRGIPLADEQLGIFVDLELSELDLPIPSADIVIGASRHKVTVQLPHVTRIRVEGHFEIHSGETLMLIAADPTVASEVLVLLKTTRQ